MTLTTHQHCQISLRCATDHVRDKALVSRRVQDGEVLLFRLKIRTAYLHCFTLISLLLICIKSPREVPEENTKMIHFKTKTAVLVMP